MKKVMLFLLAIIVSTTIYAQSQRDIIYLNNGSIIHGTVIEMTPNESVKIKNSYGDILVYKMDEVKKIEKEQVKEETHRPSVKGPEKGYRGMIEFGGVIVEISKYASQCNITTTHGYQINPYLFIGGGIGYRAGDYIEAMLAFGDLRFTLNKRHSVFVDFKAGHGVYGDGKLYLAPTVGYRFGINSKLGAYAGAGYDALWGVRYYRANKETNDGSIMLKCGFEW